MKAVGLRTYLFGLHNPALHTFLLLLSWRSIYKSWPNFKEFVCLLIHDVGYIQQDILDGPTDNHPMLGAKIAGRLFGEEYYELCAGHSRDFATKHDLELSRLALPDKFWPFLLPSSLFALIIRLGGERKAYERSGSNRWGQPIQVSLIKRDYLNWLTMNGSRLLSRRNY